MGGKWQDRLVEAQETVTLLVVIALPPSTRVDFEELNRGARHVLCIKRSTWTLEGMALSLEQYTWGGISDELNHLLKERNEKEREMSIEIALMIKDPLPEDVVIEILSWLPVKTLLQFKCVCKSWYAIITNHKFISKHLANYYNNRDHGCLLAQYYVSHAELQLFELLMDETPRVLSYEVLYGMPMYASYVCGPCDGIFYLYYSDLVDRALWNPAINELKSLPPIITKPNLPSNITCSPFDIYGFGLDPRTNDYKVIVLKSYWSKTDDDDSGMRHPLSVFVYSLRTDSWSYWGDLAHNYFLDNNKCYICVNGVFYWMGLYEGFRNTDVIISFDMATNAYQEIKVPNYEEPACKSLAVYHDSIALFSVHEINKVFDIWSLGDGNWTKKITIGPIEGLWRPVGHWKSEKLILESISCELILCDAIAQEVKYLGFCRPLSCQGIVVYKESLVSFKDRKGRGQHEKAEAESSQGKTDA